MGILVDRLPRVSKPSDLHCSFGQLTMNTLPVTIFSGFPGAGKTTVIQHLLNESPELRIGSIDINLNDGNWLTTVPELVRAGRFEYLVMESPGDSEPNLVADVFSSTDENDDAISDLLSIDTMVTVVDAENFLDDFQSVEEFQDRGLGINNDDRDIVRVLLDQIEFANVILLNKTDLVTAEESGQLLALLSKLNPDARVLAIEHGKVLADEIIKTERFQRDASGTFDAWQSMLTGDDAGESDEYGISSFVYRARRPFHPQRFWDFWMDGEHAPNILRSKGYFWLATKNAMSGLWSHAGQVLAAEPGGAWWAETPRAEWPKDDPELLAELNSLWDEVWGDRRQELIIIGQDLDADEARDALNGCLLTDSEMHSGPSSWASLADPFGCWEPEHICDGSHDHDHR